MSADNEILIFGCGGHARSIIDLIESTNKFKIIGLVGKKNDLGKEILGYPVLAWEDDLEKIKIKSKNAVIAVGQIKSMQTRQKIFKFLKSNNFYLPRIISKYSYLSEYGKIGDGTTIGHYAVVNAGAEVGECCIINSKSCIEHDVKIGKFCHISTGALINGNVKIGNNCFIGSGTIIREGLTIPNDTIIGAGKCVMGWPIIKNN